MSTEHPKTSFLKQIFHYFSASIVSNIITVATFPFFTRHLSPADYGVVSLFVMFGSVVMTVATMGIHISTFRFYFAYRENPQQFKLLNSTNLSFLLGMYLICGTLIWFLASAISLHIFKGEISATLIRLSFLSGCLEYLTTYFIFQISAQRRSLAFSVIISLKLILNLGTAAILILFFDLTYMSRIWGLLFSQIAAAAIVMYMCRGSFGPIFSMSLFKKSVAFSLPQLPMSVLGIAGQSLDKTMLSRYVGLAPVGYYDFAIKIAGFLSLIWDSLVRTWSPFFLENAAENSPESRQRIVVRYFEIASLILVVALAVSCFSEEMIRILATPAFYPAMYIVPIYVYSYLMNLFAMISYNQLMHSGKMIYQLPSAIVGMVFNIALNIILIPLYGAVGAALAVVLAGLASDLVLLYFGQKAYPLPINNRKQFLLLAIHVSFTSLLYPVMMSSFPIFAKVAIKLMLLLLFAFTLVRLKFLSLSNIRSVLLRIPVARRLVQA